MDELNDCRQFMVMSPRIAHCTRRQQDQSRPHALPASADDVFCNLPNKHHFGMQAIADDRVHGLHVGPDQGVKLFQNHIEPAFC